MLVDHIERDAHDNTDGRPHRHRTLETTPIAQQAIDLVGALYSVEHQVKAQRLSGFPHLDFLKLHAAPIHERLKKWLDAQSPKHPPKSPLGKAIRYGLGQWKELSVFLEDASVPLDNNLSERALRRIALGRKNYLFVGDREAGQSLACLYSLIATCEARGINPYAYLVDVLIRATSA